MDKKKLHINDANGKRYPQPDVPAEEAWQQMQQLLGHAPAAGSAGRFSTGKLKGFSHFIYPAALVIVASVVIYVAVIKKQHANPANITYTSKTTPRADTLAGGAIAFLDTNSSITVTGPLKEPKLITIDNGGCYFRQSNKDTGTTWQIIAGQVRVLPQNANMYLSVDPVTEVAVVQVQTGSAEIQMGDKKLLVNAGESIRFNTQKNILYNRQKLNPNLSSYANKVFEFNDTPLKEVAGFLEKAYGVTIVIKNSNLYNCRVTTKFDNKPLNEIFDILAYTLGFEYSINEKNKLVTISGDGCN